MIIKLQVIFLSLITFGSSMTLAEPLKREILFSIADDGGYRDNRQTLSRDKIYSASKGCCGLKPYVVLEGFPQTEGQDFKQVALFCDHCGVKEISNEQTQLCQMEFERLYKKLNQLEPTAELKASVGLSKKRSKDPNGHYSLRFTTGFLKCDIKGGHRIRVDFFPVSP